MELNGAFSNPFLSDKSLLTRLYELHRRLLETAAEHPWQARSAPSKTSPVLKTVTLVLALAGEPMQAREIHFAAEELLGKPVRWPSVRAALSAYAIGGDRRFRRVGHGRYELQCGPRGTRDAAGVATP
jgi:hypothetical protein